MRETVSVTLTMSPELLVVQVRVKTCQVCFLQDFKTEIMFLSLAFICSQTHLYFLELSIYKVLHWSKIIK